MTSFSQQTIPGQFLALVERIPDKTALMEKQGDNWVSTSFKEWEARSRAVAVALINDGVQVQDSVSVFSFSKRQWLEADMGILFCGAKTATIYQNLAGETVDHILNDAQVKVIFVEGPIQLRAIFGENRQHSLPESLTKIVYFENSQRPPSRAGKPARPALSLLETVPEQYRTMVVSFEDYIQNGRELLDVHNDALAQRIAAILPEHVAKVVYTSGTTGMPKGALLSHRNLTSVTADFKETIGLHEAETTLLFLPLAHVYAQLVYHAQVRIGFAIAFAQSMYTAMEDAESVKPNFFISVPRLFEKIYSNIEEKVSQGGLVKKAIFSWAIHVGEDISKRRQYNVPLSASLSVKSKIANKLVFSTLRKKLGGNVRMMISGGAPLQSEIVEFFHAAGLLIIEGYGMTENASLSHHNRITQYKLGTVGLPVRDTEVLIAEDGEILLRSPGNMRGYLNLPKETRETIDDAGWLHTGDIGCVDGDGYLKITDRKKDIIVTSGGKNVAPAPIESLLCQLKYVSQAVVFGNKRQFLTALLTLDADATQLWAAQNGIDGSNESLCQNGLLKKHIDNQVISMNQKLEQYETIKKYVIAPREFSIAEGEVTPSLKLRKRIIEQRYGYLIDALYVR